MIRLVLVSPIILLVLSRALLLKGVRMENGGKKEPSSPGNCDPGKL